MGKTLDIQELAIVVVARNHNPTILNPDFLKYNGIVPAEWDLAKPPVCVEPMAQVTFQNGVSVIAQFDKVIFSETISAKDGVDAIVPGIARKYVETLPHVDYRAVGINPKGHVMFGNEGATRKYLVETLLAPGPWREFGRTPVRAAVKFGYTLERGQCNLTVDEARLQLGEGQLVPVVLFSANFHHDLSGDTRKERLCDVFDVIENWRVDFETFRELVDNRFLKHEGE